MRSGHALVEDVGEPLGIGQLAGGGRLPRSPSRLIQTERMANSSGSTMFWEWLRATYTWRSRSACVVS